jgi:hypothetical protein
MGHGRKPGAHGIIQALINALPQLAGQPLPSHPESPENRTNSMRDSYAKVAAFVAVLSPYGGGLQRRGFRHYPQRSGQPY